MTNPVISDVEIAPTRDELVEQIRGHLAEDRSVLLVGESGLGKSYLLGASAPPDRPTLVGGGLRTLADHPYVAVGRAIGQLAMTGDAESVTARVFDHVGDRVLIVDDLHDADPASVDVLAAAPGRIAVLAASWPDDPSRRPVVARLVAAGYVRIDVGPLTDVESRALASEILGPQRIDVVDDLVVRAGGVPLLLEELARGDAGPSLTGSIRTRLSALSPDTRDAALDLAVSGRPMGTGEIDPEAADALVRVGIARTAGAGSWVIQHALVGDAVIATSPPDRVLESHRRSARRTGEPDEQVVHLLAAGDIEAARAVALVAAENAASERERIRWASRAATLAFDDASSSPSSAALELLDVADALVRTGQSAAHTELLKQCSERIDPYVLDPEPAARLRWHLGRGAWESSDTELAQAEVAAGLQLVAGTGLDIEASLLTVSVRFALLSGVELPDVEHRLARAGQIAEVTDVGHGQLLGTRALVAYFSGRDDAASLFEAAAAAARTAGDIDMELRAATNAITAGETQGDRSHVLALATDYTDYAARLGLGDWEAQFAALAANVQYHLGDYAGALRSLDRLESLALDPWTQEMGVGIRMQCMTDLGQLDEVSTLFDTDIASHLNSADSSRTVLMGWAALWEGRADVALQLASTGDTSAHGVLAPYLAVVAAWACDDLGRAVEATVPADAQVLPMTRPLLTEVDGVRLLSSDPFAAADLLALAAVESRKYSYGQAVRQAWGAAEAARRAGRSDAVDLLLAVEEEAVDAGLAPIVARARRSLRLAGVVRTSERSIDRTGLVSPREREVLELVAAGLTNNEIARRLGVGRPTVRRLTDRARAKLGARDRVEAAAILARRESAV